MRDCSPPWCSLSRLLSPWTKHLLCRRLAWVAGQQLRWPLHDIAITKTVWCMAYKRGVGGGGGGGGGRIWRISRAVVVQ